MSGIIDKIIRTEGNRQEELQKLCQFPAEDIVGHLEDAIISTNIVVNGFTLGDGFHDDGANIMFAGILELRDSLIDAIEWIKVNIMHEKIVDFENVNNENQLNYEDDDDKGDL